MARLIYALFLVLLIAKPAVSVPSCLEVYRDLVPCLSYFFGVSKNPPKECCAGMKALQSIEKTREDRVATCKCGKQALSMYLYDPKKLALLPGVCGVDMNMPTIDKNLDCSTLYLSSKA